jgi:hypothetical protein
VTIATLIGGRYSGTLGGADLGITESGFTIIFNPKAELINESDAYGLTLIDLFWRGIDVSTVFDSLEYKAGTITAAWPWGTLGAMGVIARLGSAIASSMVLTATAGTPAAATPATLTAARSLLEPGFNVSLLFNSKLRRVPIRFVNLPSDSAIHITTT